MQTRSINKTHEKLRVLWMKVARENYLMAVMSSAGISYQLEWTGLPSELLI